MQDLTTGSITRHLLKTTGFMLVTMVFQTLYYLVDLYWIGRLGREAVAGVGLAGNLMFIVLAVTQMLAVGTTTLVSHAAGRKDSAQALLVFNQALVLSVLTGGIFYLVAVLVGGSYAHHLSADAPTAAQATAYLRWFLPAMGLQFGLVAMSAALRGTGNFKPGMIVQSVTVILNMALTPVLMFGWMTGRPLGVAGAGLATFIAVGAGSIWLSVWFLTPHAYLKFVPADWKPRLDLWHRLLGIGLPAGAEFALMAVYLVLVYALSKPFGAAAQAGFGIGMRVIQALFMPILALGFAVAPVAGQNFGAGQAHRVRETFRSAVLMAAGAMAVLTVICHISPIALIRVFSSDADVLAVGEEYLRIVSWNFVASGIIFVGSSMFQAMGNTLPALTASSIRLVTLAVPALVLSTFAAFELRWIWYLAVASVVCQLAANLLLLRREFRLRLGVNDSAAGPAWIH